MTIVWALFDSGNGCYYQASKQFKEIELYSIGLDYENKNSHFINCNLAEYNLFGKNTLYSTLDKLPKPDVIIASPPCESWSIASAMPNGNACWKQEKGDSLFKPLMPLSKFTIRNYSEYMNWRDGHYSFEKQFIKRINGELCTFNLIQIIKRYDPKIYIIENPATSRIWEYINKILGFELKYDNLTYYNNYDYPVAKPTKFKSNLKLNLKTTIIPNDVPFNNIKGYNNRSNIPINLIVDIFSQVLENIREENLWEKYHKKN